MPGGGARSRAVGEGDGGAGFGPQSGYAGAPGIGGTLPNPVDSAFCRVSRREAIYGAQRTLATLGHAPLAGAGRRTAGVTRRDKINSEVKFREESRGVRRLMIFRMVLDAQLVETDPEVESKVASEAGRDSEAASDVIEACRRGEADAFTALFELHRDRVYSIALRFSGDPSVALSTSRRRRFSNCCRKSGSSAARPALSRGSTG